MIETVNIGTGPNTGDGDPLRSAMQKINDNFDFLAQEGGYVNVQNYGAVGDGVTDNTGFITQALADVSDGTVLVFPSGTYVVDTVTVGKDVSFQLCPGAILLHKANATGDMFVFNVTCTGFFSGGVVDGNKSNQVLTTAAGRKNLITFDSDGMVFSNTLYQNYVNGALKSTTTEGSTTIVDCQFIDGAEHGGDLGETSCAIIFIYHSSGLSNIAPEVNVTRCRFVQSAAPSVAGKAPGGVYVHGLDSSSVFPSLTVRDCFFKNIGQNYAGNAIGNIDAYEDNRQVAVDGNRFVTPQYVPVKIQNAARVSVTSNFIMADTALLVNAIWLDFAERTDLTGTGDCVVSGNFIFDAVNAEALIVQGVNAKGRDIMVAHNRIKNCKGGIIFQGTQGMEGSVTIVGNIVEAVGSGYGALQFGNFSGVALISGNSFSGGSSLGNGCVAATGLSSATLRFVGNYFQATQAGHVAFAVRGVGRLFVDGNQFNHTAGNVAVLLGVGGGNNTGVLTYGNSNFIINGTRTMPPSEVDRFVGWFEGLVSPEGAYAAQVNAVCAYSGTSYMKNSGSGNTGWVAM